MTDSENPKKPKEDVDTILAEFDNREDLLAAFCAKTKSLIEACLQDAGIRYQSVQVRVKTKNKLREKYLDPAKNYQSLGDITDLAGLRIITYYEDEVDQVAKLIEREFNIDPKNSVDKRSAEPDRFGYTALNYVCEHLEKRKTDVEYKKFAGVRGEIQITSILRHAWSEMEHEWYDLKDAYPDSVKRRFYRIAALLELAESEFLDIRKSRTQYERSVALRVEAKIPDLPVDGVSLRSFVEQDPLVGEIDGEVAVAIGAKVSPSVSDKWIEMTSKAATFVGMTKFQNIRDNLAKYRTAIPEFVLRWTDEVAPTRNKGGLQVSKGISVLHLSLLLASARGEEGAVEFLKVAGLRAVWDNDRLVALAREILAKHPS
jgi:putative GTP pyrophosphokinase